MDNVAILTAWDPSPQIITPWPAPPQIVESTMVVTPPVIVQGAIFEAIGSKRLNSAARAGIGRLSTS